MEPQTYLSFILRNELFAIEVKSVLEVLRNQLITPVPNCPDYILGILNFRGEIVTVVDSSKKLFHETKEERKNNIVIICEIDIQGHTAIIGTTADAVKNVFQSTSQQIISAPEFGSSIKLDMVSGVIKRNNKFIMLINSEQLFDTD